MVAPVMIDLFCGGGAASVGYARAGLTIGEGVDLFLQPEYPFKFTQADWKAWLRRDLPAFDIVHGSPVCKGYTNVRTTAKNQNEHAREIAPLRRALNKLDVPYVIENVESARSAFINPIMLCGSSFGLRVRRHRLFESNLPIVGKPCDHEWQDADKIYLRRGRYSKPTLSGVCPVNGEGKQLLNVSREEEHEARSKAMNIDWMSWTPLTQAIPPDYTEHIGTQLMRMWVENPEEAV